MAVDRIGEKNIVLLFLMTTLTLFYFVMFQINPSLDGVDGMGVLQLQLAFDKSVGEKIINAWKNLTPLKFQFAMWVDSLYALSYGLFFASLASFTLKSKNMFTTRYRYLVYLPFLATILDWIENIIEAIFVSSVGSISSTLFFLHSVVASIKWLCLPMLFILLILILKRKN